MYNIPESIQHKQLGLVWCKSNLINRVIHQLHLRIQHRIDAFEIEQVTALHIDDVVGVSRGRVAWVDVLRQHALVIFEAGRSHVGRGGRVRVVVVIRVLDFLLLLVLPCCAQERVVTDSQ